MRVLNSEATSGTAPSPAKFGRFYLQDLINSGGMADIWIASDGQGKHYALRRMHARYRFNFFAKRRFMRGCEILGRNSPITSRSSATSSTARFTVNRTC